MGIRGVFLVIALWLTAAEQVTADVNGGVGCAVCAAITGLLDQMATLHNSTLEQEFINLCNLFPEGIIKDACVSAISEFATVIVDLYDELGSIDLACHAIGMCYVDPGEGFCHLFPLPEARRVVPRSKSAKLAEFRRKFGTRVALCDLPGLKELCEAIERMANNLPFIDDDLDKFSTWSTLRGSDWRGKDCDDSSASVYPGRRPENGDAEVDSNCNGIYGVNEETGVTYEEELCGGQTNYGILIFGDSAGANFHIPKQWLTPSLINKEVFSYLPYVVSNELNFPMSSSTTGYKDLDDTPIVEGHTDSVYLRMLERNRCIHRDIQNIARNGGKSSNVFGYAQTMARNPDNDNPLFMSLALIGNDVCNGKKDPLPHMTTPEQMKERLLEMLNWLDTTVPAGSHLILTGLVDGRVLWDKLHARVHPIGEIRGDVRYEDLYDYLNCLQVSPCGGWMTSNSTLRDLTSQRAAELSDAVAELARENVFTNFDMVYMEFAVKEVMDEWEQVHGPGTGWQLIEIVDGFHPSQYGQAAFAAKTWEILERDFPELLGEVNPNNQKIIDLFGDQGGYD